MRRNDSSFIATNIMKKWKRIFLSYPKAVGHELPIIVNDTFSLLQWTLMIVIQTLVPMVHAQMRVQTTIAVYVSLAGRAQIVTVSELLF